MKMKIAVATLGLFMLLQSTTFGKKHMKTKRLLSTNRRNVMADALLEVEPLPPDVVMSECTCRCCEQTPAPLTSPLCANDVVMAVDSSACFRDYYSRMMRFLRKLVRRIGRTPNIQYGGDETRLSLMQFSSDIVFPLELSSFEHYTNPSTKKGILEGINDQLDNLQFLGEGSFLNKALNATVSHIQSQPRPQNLLDQISPVVPRKVVIIMTNGKSHPSVTMNNIETSIAAMENEGITVIPVSVTRECHGFQSDQWNEGLCPDTVVLGKLAKVGRDESSSFMEMTSQDTIPDILNILECHPQASSLTAAPCNNCTCSCELPVGPRGPEGPRGVKGDFVQGKPGIDGETGSKGEVGEKGDRGPVGEKGSVGEKGIFGDKGEPGNVGEKGDTGDIGPMGKVGQKGEVGDIGPKGAIGKIGPEGPKGDEGEKGEVGEQGKVGNKGEEGEKGTKGDSGNKGSKGVGEKGRKGQPGPVGPEGPDGRKGDRGPKGDEGKRGLCGKPGPAGKRGIEGVPGVDGIDGPAGPQGTQGPRGQVGLHGDKGGPGEPGTNGEEGPRGFPGERGRPGPQGADGLKGEKGEPSREIGPQGFSGPSGQKGEPGVEGADGLDGREGPSGRQGPTGPPGPPGPPAVYNLEELRPIIVDIIRELLPGECVANKPNGCNEYAIDLAFLVDGSDSIDRSDFEQVESWILSTVDAFNPSARRIPLHVNVVQFSEQSQKEVQQMVEHSSDEIADVVHSIHQMRSGTKSYSALRFVNNNLYPDLRENSFKILITMTDGDASEDKDIEAIQQARSNFNMMIAAGVGEKVNNDTLEDFSSSQDYIINVNNFVELKSTISSIVENTCSGIDAILSGMEEPGDTTAAPTTTSAAPSSSTTLAPGCYKAFGDLAFVLDGSASVGETGFAELQRFLLELIKEIPNIGNDGVQVAIIQYNNQPRVEINFEDYSNKNDLLDAITFIEYLDGNTRTGAALETLSGLFVEAARPDRKKVGVVITDGRSQDDVTGPSEQLREDGVSLFAVGVGEAEYVELREIASQPTDRYILSVNNYASITQIREELLSKICSAAEGLYISAEESEAGIEDDLLIPDRKLLTTPAFSREVDETSGEMEFTL